MTEPRTYISTYTDDSPQREKVWTVIVQGLTICQMKPDWRLALTSYRLIDKTTPFDEIPVWDGDNARFVNLTDFGLTPPA